MKGNKAAKGPQAFKVGANVKIGPLNGDGKEGEVVGIIDFENRKVKIGKSVRDCHVSELSEIVEENAG